MTRLQFQRSSVTQRRGLAVAHFDRRWNPDDDFEVRLSRRMNEALRRYRRISNVLWTLVRNGFVDEAETELIEDFIGVLDSILCWGAPVESYGEALETVAPVLMKLEATTGGDFIRKLEELEEIQAHLEAKWPLESFLFKHMNDYLELIFKRGAEERHEDLSGEYSFAGVVWRSYSYPSDIKLACILKERELFISKPSHYRLNGYCEALKAFARDQEVSEQAIDGLNDQLLLELQWFGQGIFSPSKNSRGN